MSRFWTGVGILFVVAVVAIFVASGSSKLTVNDLETECRGYRSSHTDIKLNSDDSMSFSGYFPVENPEADMDYRYSRSGDKIVLDVRSQSLPAPESFWDNCLASGVYDLDTGSLPEETYSVEVKHNGERTEKKIIRVE